MNEPQPEYVGFWVRFGASLIDSILMMVVLVPVGRFFGIGTSLDSMRFDSPANIMVNGVLPAIAVILFWFYRQATPGKMAIGMLLTVSAGARVASTGPAATSSNSRR